MNGTVAPSARRRTTASTRMESRDSSMARAGTGSKPLTPSPGCSDVLSLLSSALPVVGLERRKAERFADGRERAPVDGARAERAQREDVLANRVALVLREA